MGRTVQKGIAARVLQYANELLYEAYEVEEGPDLDDDGEADWYYPVFNAETGEPIVRYDPFIEGEHIYPEEWPQCDDYDNTGCTCTDNRACVRLKHYVEVPFFLRQTLDAYGLWDFQPDGIWD